MWRMFSIFVAYFWVKFVGATMDNDNEERSQRGMALLKHTYKSFYTENYSSCLMACMHDAKCMSLNYWWNISRCDLNNKTKYSAEAVVYSREMSSTYMGLTREPGILTIKNVIDANCTIKMSCVPMDLVVINLTFFSLVYSGKIHYCIFKADAS